MNDTAHTIRIPPFIRPGDTLGVPAPAFGCTREPYLSRYHEAVRRLEQRGYQIRAGGCVMREDGCGISSAPWRTGAELEAFFHAPDVAALISAGGGELMCTTVSHVRFESLRNLPPKWFMGYSDNTNFIHPYVTICRTAAIYGPCITGLGKPWEQGELDAVGLLEGTRHTVRGYPLYQSPLSAQVRTEQPLAPYVLTEKKELALYDCATGASRRLGAGEAVRMEGVLLGGCLDVLAGLTGTPLDAMAEFNRTAGSGGVIWVLEACDLGVMDIRRALWHLRECGWFSTAAGFVIGRPLAAFGQSQFGTDQYGAVLDEVASLRAPVIMDADVGHIPPAMPLVLGSHATVTAAGDDITVAMRLA